MRQVCQLLVVAACATLLMPIALPAKAPKNPPPSRIDPNELKAQLMAQMKREIHKEVDALRHEIKRAHAACYIQSEKAGSVGDKDPIPFQFNSLTNSKIACQEGVLTLPSKGTYLVTYGVTTKEAKNSFELQLSEMPLPGGRLSVDSNLQQAMGSLSLLVTAEAGDRLQIVNTSGKSAKIGSDKKDAIAAFISVVQLH